MVTVYHGSNALFLRPDFSRIENISTYGTNEYGFGFYASVYGGDAHDRLNKYKPGFIYALDIPDERYERNWIKSNEPIGAEKRADILALLEKRGKNDMAKRLSDMGP